MSPRHEQPIEGQATRTPSFALLRVGCNWRFALHLRRDITVPRPYVAHREIKCATDFMGSKLVAPVSGPEP